MCKLDAVGEARLGQPERATLVIEVKGSWQILHDISRNYAEILLDLDFERRKQVFKTLGQVLGYMVGLHPRKTRSLETKRSRKWEPMTFA